MAGAGQVPDTKPAGAGQVPVSVAAGVLGVSERTIRRYLSLGKLAKVPDSKPVLIDLDTSVIGHEKPAGAGQMPDRKPAGAGQVPVSDTPDLVAQLQSENAFLRDQVKQQARTIERQAEAHAVIAAQLSRFQEIEAAPVRSDDPAGRMTPGHQKQGFWSRLFS